MKTIHYNHHDVMKILSKGKMMAMIFTDVPETPKEWENIKKMLKCDDTEAMNYAFSDLSIVEFKSKKEMEKFMAYWNDRKSGRYAGRIYVVTYHDGIPIDENT